MLIFKCLVANWWYLANDWAYAGKIRKNIKKRWCFTCFGCSTLYLTLLTLQIKRKATCRHLKMSYSMLPCKSQPHFPAFLLLHDSNGRENYNRMFQHKWKALDWDLQRRSQTSLFWRDTNSRITLSHFLKQFRQFWSSRNPMQEWNWQFPIKIFFESTHFRSHRSRKRQAYGFGETWVLKSKFSYRTSFFANWD